MALLLVHNMPIKMQGRHETLADSTLHSGSRVYHLLTVLKHLEFFSLNSHILTKRLLNAVLMGLSFVLVPFKLGFSHHTRTQINVVIGAGCS